MSVSVNKEQEKPSALEAAAAAYFITQARLRNTPVPAGCTKLSSPVCTYIFSYVHILHAARILNDSDMFSVFSFSLFLSHKHKHTVTIHTSTARLVLAAGSHTLCFDSSADLLMIQ